MRNYATRGADGRPNVLGPAPPGLVGCLADGEAADIWTTSNFPFSMMRVASGEPPKGHLDVRWAHRVPPLPNAMAGERRRWLWQPARREPSRSTEPTPR